jgi:hypothetical protein
MNLLNLLGIINYPIRYLNSLHVTNSRYLPQNHHLRKIMMFDIIQNTPVIFIHTVYISLRIYTKGNKLFDKLIVYTFLFK